ncbi:MAG: UDP-N-acetylmuramoyl-L-alanyl-D-glutamate--2,6-diaminopimelate ligase, partial [Aestuariivirgaceae bacterium]
MAMLLSELAGGLVPPGLGRVEITGLTADSREVAPGYLFAALPGTQVDGARFIEDAIAAGAVAILGPRTLPPGIGGNVPVLREDNPRKTLTLMAARFAGHQPETVVAVTGTNGKTSVAAFVRQIWASMRLRAASMGTTGIIGPEGVQSLVHTTPEPVTLHEALNDLDRQGVTHLALAASSHGLQQNRLDGVAIAAGAFTNLTRDHLDYHADFDEYFAAKMRLFDDLLAPGATAVINADMPEAGHIILRCRENGLKVVSTGVAGADIKLVKQERDGFGQKLAIQHDRQIYNVHLPLVGAFQASNALVAAGLVIATGGQPDNVFAALGTLEGASGRLQLVATADCGAPVFVDYAHTPDALENALRSLRPYADKQLKVVFGCGGDRDAGKRPQMGAIAAEQADVCYVTDDNPRTEDPGAIRAEIIAACPGGIEVAGRAEAIERAVGSLEQGDVLLVAGKGHETGQIVAGETIP